MNASASYVVSIQVGPVAPLGPKCVPSGFVKRPVAGAVTASFAGLAGDEQADRRVHGGCDKAVYGYPDRAYAWWAAEFPHLAARFVPGSLGENLTIAGADEREVRIGDRWRIGGALLQVSEPRQPCFKLALAFGEAKLARAMIRSGRCGWYYRVLEPGSVAAGDTVDLVDRPNPDWPVRRLFEIVTAPTHGREALAAMLAIDGLGERLKLKAIRGLAGERVGF